MKEYVKPVFEFVQLSADERFACSRTTSSYRMPKHQLPEQKHNNGNNGFVSGLGNFFNNFSRWF